MDVDESTDANEPHPGDFVIRAHSVSPSFIIQMDTGEVRECGCCRKINAQDPIVW